MITNGDSSRNGNGRKKPNFKVCTNGCAEIVFMDEICLDCFLIVKRGEARRARHKALGFTVSGKPRKRKPKQPRKAKDGDLPCIFEGCEKPQKNRRTGYCTGHQKQLDDGRELKPLLPPQKKKVKRPVRRKWPATCMVPYCDGKHKSMGYCNKHYSRNPRPLRWKENWRDEKFHFVCKVDGCTEETTHLLCLEHLEENYQIHLAWEQKKKRPKNAQLNKAKKRKGWADNGAKVTLNEKGERICNLEGCNGSHAGHGWCQTHLGQVRRGDEPYLILDGEKRWKRRKPKATPQAEFSDRPWELY